MPHAVRPKVFFIGRTQANNEEIRQWMDHVGADKYAIENDVTGGEQIVQLAGKRCYMSFQPGLNPNVQRVRSDMADFINNILAVGHGSVLEHAYYNFAIEGVSRVFTAEMNRHRAGMAISEGSMRFIRFTDIPWVQPPSMRMTEADSHEICVKKRKSIDVFDKVFQAMQDGYAELQEIWKDELHPDSTFKDKKNVTSMMRRIVGMGVATGGVWTGNLRALRHIFTMRCDSVAEEEILEVACMLLEKMKDEEPLFFKDFELKDGYWRPKYWKV